MIFPWMSFVSKTGSISSAMFPLHAQAAAPF
jgi:hypothetical protein